MAEIRVGQTWRSEDGYLYRIVAVDFPSPKHVFARHPNAKQGGYSILRAWFDQPGWGLVREAA